MKWFIVTLTLLTTEGATTERVFASVEAQGDRRHPETPGRRAARRGSEDD